MRVIHLITTLHILSFSLLFGCGQSDPPTRTVGKPADSASFEVSPPTGSPGTVFSFEASATFGGAGAMLKFRWDWENDGVWDTEFSTETVATHSFETVGYKKIRLEATDEQSSKSATTVKEILVAAASDEMVRIPAGEFVMGSLDGKGNDDEHPQHTLFLDEFLISKYEVTNQQYIEFLNVTGENKDAGGHLLVNLDIAAIKEKNGVFKAVARWENHPVVGVSWYGATAYAEWAGGRLPTEAEWEKAARGNDGRKYPWGDVWRVIHCNSWESELRQTTLVGSYPEGVSPYGVHDLAGNVYEWVSDWYSADYYKVSPRRNPKGPASGVFRIVRGGSWSELADKCKSTIRVGQLPDSADADFGFRIVKD